MAEKRKSIIDEALLESEQIEKAFEANAKEILTRTMSSEIEDMVKESLEGSIGLMEDEDEEEIDLDLDLGSDEAEAGASDDLDIDLGDEEDDEDGLGLVDNLNLGNDDEGVMVNDLTSEKNINKVIDVFKKMSPEDEIEVVQTETGVELKDNETGAEYVINLGGDDEEDEDFDLELGDDEEDEFENETSEGTIYEIVLDEDDYMTEIGAASGRGTEHLDMLRDFCRKCKEDSDNMSNADKKDCAENCEGMEEGRSPRTLGKASKLPNRKSADISNNRMKMGESRNPKFLQLVNENKVLKNKVTSIVDENETLKEDYNKMVSALKQFRDKLNEVAVFNSNLTYSVRLFTENTTTKEEKLEIIKRFDDVKTLKESKNIYKQLIKEISKKEPIKESIETRLNETKSSGSLTEINESKVYSNPELEKMKKLWDYKYKQ